MNTGQFPYDRKDLAILEASVIKSRDSRIRATKRSVAPHGYETEIRETPFFFFADEQDSVARALARTRFLIVMRKPGENRLPDSSQYLENNLLRLLEELATSYNGWKEVPHLSRSVAKAELLRFQDLVSRRPELDSTETAELERLIRKPYPLAQAALWSALAKLRPDIEDTQPLFEWLQSDQVDWRLVKEALELAISQWIPRRGDYPDTALHAAIGELVRIYTGVIGRTPVRHNGHGELPPIYTFAQEFFRQADPQRAASTINNVIDATLKARSRMRDLDPVRLAAQSLPQPF